MAATTVPAAFPLPAETAVASYDYTDIATGTGMQTFYLAVTETWPAVKDYILTEETIYSKQIERTSVDFATTPYYQVDEVDWDLSAFNTPRTIKGTGYAQIGAELESGDVNAYFAIILRKVDADSNETDIVTISGSSLGGGVPTILNVPLVIPETHFKIGEVLRCSIQTWGQKNGADLRAATYGCDPQNRDGSILVPSGEDTITKSHIVIPFKLDL